MMVHLILVTIRLPLRDVNVYLVGNNLSTVPTSFRLNQVLQVVIVPANYAKLERKTILMWFQS
jgi:hypothetical protein